MVVWLIVSVVWTIGSIQLEDFIKDNAVCIDEDFISRDDDSFVQSYVAIVSLCHFNLIGCFTAHLFCRLKY